MNDNAKSKFQDKMSAVASDEELDKVAGGSWDNASFIMNDLAQFDPEAVHDHTHIANLANNKVEATLALVQGAEELLKKYVDPTAKVHFKFDDVTFEVRGQAVSFAQMRTMINNKAKLKAAGASDFEIMY